MIETWSRADDLARAAADGVAVRLRKSLAAQGRASLVGTGGRSPGRTYDRLAAMPGIDWAEVTVTLSDERCVGADATDSNLRLLRERLLVGPAARAPVLPLWPRPAEAALRALLPFDAVLLGMGEDGHVASLIPGDPGLAAALDPAGDALVADTPAGLGSPPLARVTLTLAALLASRAIFLLVAGGVKREVVERALSGEDLPVRALLVQDRVPVRVLWTPDFER
jgi:6-phosphogluconolactonase